MLNKKFPLPYLAWKLTYGILSMMSHFSQLLKIPLGLMQQNYKTQSSPFELVFLLSLLHSSLSNLFSSFYSIFPVGSSSLSLLDMHDNVFYQK